MHAAGQTRIVGADELLHLQGDEVGVVAAGGHLLGELAHVRFQVRDVLSRGRHNGGAPHATALVDIKDMEQGATRSLGKAHAATSAHVEFHRLASTLELIGRKTAAESRAAVEHVHQLHRLSDVVGEGVVLGGAQPASLESASQLAFTRARAAVM